MVMWAGLEEMQKRGLDIVLENLKSFGTGEEGCELGKMSPHNAANFIVLMYPSAFTWNLFASCFYKKWKNFVLTAGLVNRKAGLPWICLVLTMILLVLKQILEMVV
ncbi:MAG: hypothetical protein WCO56_06675 [Verrucomicrobiota bacterium]